MPALLSHPAAAFRSSAAGCRAGVISDSATGSTEHDERSTRHPRWNWYIALMQALQAIYNAVLCYGPFVLVGWAAKRYLDGWTASRGKHASEVQGLPGSDRHQPRFLLGAWHK